MNSQQLKIAHFALLVTFFTIDKYFCNTNAWAESFQVPSDINNSKVEIGSGQIGTSDQRTSINGTAESPGSLQIQGGGTANLTQGLQVGDSSNNSVGSITVTGKDSSLTVRHSDGKAWAIDIGETGTGFLTISNGAQVSSIGEDGFYPPTADYPNGAPYFGVDGHVIVGDLKNSHGTINVTGNGSTLISNAIGIIGNSGTGELNINNGGKVSFGEPGLVVGFVGKNNPSEDQWNKDGVGEGNVKVDGVNSVLESQGLINIGGGGIGVLNVTNLAQIQGQGGLIEGNTIGSSGDIRINNATLDITGTTGLTDGNSVVGVQGKGSFEATNNANATFHNGFTISEDNSAAGSTATFDHSTLTVNNNNSGSTIVGNGGNGTLVLKNGSQANVNTDLIIGQNVGATGTLDVDASNLATKGALTIGQSGAGNLTLSNNNTEIASTALKLADMTGSSGNINLSNASLTTQNITTGAGTSQINVGQVADTSNSTLNIAGNVSLTKGGQGTIAINNGAMNFTGANRQNEALDVSLTDKSSINVQQQSGTTSVSGVVSGDNGVLNKTGFGNLVLNQDNNYDGGTNIQEGMLTGHVNTDGSGSFGSGMLDTSDKTTLRISQNQDGSLNQKLTGAGDLLINANGSEISLSGDESQHTGKTILQNGSAILSSETSYGGDFDIGSNGHISGLGKNNTATINGNVYNNGTLLVGSGDAKQTGTLNINGNLSLTNGSNTTWAESTTTDKSQSGFANAAVGNDLINVNGNLSLGDSNGAAIINVKSALENNKELGLGAYRLINYSGSLNTQNANLGSITINDYHMASLETSVDKEINLLITDKTVDGQGTIWNGGAVTDAANNVVEHNVVGGDGIWSNVDTYNLPNSHSSISWAQPDKDSGEMTYGKSWADSKGAIFQGKGGTVQVSNTLNGEKSQVKATSLIFNANGYTLTGDTLSDAGTGMMISVGDGHPENNQYAANINNQLSTHGIVKEGVGILNLNSDGNTATTGFDVQRGTLNLNGQDNQIGGTSNVQSGGMLNANGKNSLGSSLLRINQGGQANISLQSISDTASIIDDGRLDIGGSQNNATIVQNESGTFKNTISGSGVLNKFGTGSIDITGNNANFSGQTQVNNGTLNFNGTDMSGSAVIVAANGVADGSAVQKSATFMASNGAKVNSITLADNSNLKNPSATGNTLIAAGLSIDNNFSISSNNTATLNKAIGSDYSLQTGGDLTVAANGGNNSFLTLNDSSNAKISGSIGLGNALFKAANSEIATDGNFVLGGKLTDDQNTNTTARADISGTNLNIGESITLNNGVFNAADASVVSAKQAMFIGFGNNNEGTFNLKNDSSLAAKNLVVGTNNANGNFNADGKNTNVKLNGQMTIGSNGTGKVNLTNGASLSTENLIIGANNGSGKLNIKDNESSFNTAKILLARDSGNESSLNTTKQAIIGDSGNGTLNVSGEGNAFTSNNTLVANQKDSIGLLNFSDGANLNAQGALVHGDGFALTSLTNANLNAIGDLYENVDTSLNGQNQINTDKNFVAIDGKLSGTGGFDKTGSGILQINNTENNYTGTTHITQGILEGVGTIGGDLNINTGSTLRAGISSDPSVQYGKMQVNGNTTMQNGSIMEASLGLYPASSGLTDNGSFNIGNDTTLHTTIAEGAQLQINQAYNIVHADKGVTGKFTTYQQDGKIGSDAPDGYAVLKGDVGHPAYGSNDINVTLTFDKDKGLDWGGNRDQTNTGSALTPSVEDPNSPLHDLADTLAGSDNNQRLNNLTQMDGEIAGDMRASNINQNFWIRDAVNNRLDCLEDTFRQIGNGKTTGSNVCGVSGKKVNVWGNMYGGLGGQNGHSGWNYANSTSERNAGFIWGVDSEIGSNGYVEDRWHAGMMMGYGSVMLSSGGVASHGESNNANIGMYVGKQVRFSNQNFFTFHGQFGYTWNVMNWHRSVNLQGAAAQYNQNLHAHELGGTAHINAEIAYKHVFNLGGTPLEVAPTGAITYLNYEQGSYHEHGGNLALHGAARNTNLGYGFMGAKLATNVHIKDWTITPHGKFGYLRAFGANQSLTNAGFSALGSNTNMSIVSVPVVQDQALTEVGFDVHPTDFFSFSANYVGLYGGRSRTMSGGQLSAKIAF